jgi:aldehyde:ferredoxin oxidoreductase
MTKDKIVTLKLDLNSKIQNISDQDSATLSLEEKLGGFGKGLHDTQEYLQNQKQPIIDAYDPRNMLCIDLGFLTGTKLMTARRTIFTGISPLKTSNAKTNGIFYSTASGDLGPAIAQNGFDSIRLTGKLNKPSYIVFDNGQVRIEDATDIIGKTTDEKINILKSKYEKAAFAVVGPAAENMVRYASIAFSTTDQLKNGTKNMRFAGRGGFGSVLASKNILGIVAMGDKPVYDIGDVVSMNRDIASGKKTEKYRSLGTFFANIFNQNVLGVAIHDNFSRGRDERATSLQKDKVLSDGYGIKDKGCKGCGIRCWKEILSKEGIALGKIDYEPGALLGTNLGIYDIEKTMSLIELSDTLGLDAISTGTSLGYEMELRNKFGDFEFAKDLIYKIAKNEHGLAQGVKRYSNNASIAMQTKGIEFPAYLGHINPGFAFAIAGQHMSMDTYNSWVYKDSTTEATNSIDEWVENIIRGPQMILYDMNGLCKFAKVSFDDVSKLYDTTYGTTTNGNDMRNVAKRIHMLARRIDQSQGFNESDDTLPDKCFEVLPNTDAPYFNTKEFFNKVKEGVLNEYKNYKF